MKKGTLLITVLGVIMMCSGCHEQEEAYNNLDLSLISKDFTEIPKELAHMETDLGTWSQEKIEGEFLNLLNCYGDVSPEQVDIENDILFDCLRVIEDTEEDTEETEHLFLPLKELNTYDEIRYLHYYGDDFYLNMVEPGMFEFYRSDVVKRVTGEEWKGVGSWRPNFTADPIATYTIGQDDLVGVSYMLDGKDVSLQQAITNVEDYMTDNEDLPNLSVPGIEYRVKTVDVYAYGENHGYFFILNCFCDGVQLNDVSVSDEEGIIHYVEVAPRCMTLTGEGLDYIWGNTFKQMPQLTEMVEIQVSYEEALQAMSDYLSDDFVFQVLDADLLFIYYKYWEIPAEGDIASLHPYWQFELSTEGMQQYSRLIINVDVTTGEVIERSI